MGQNRISFYLLAFLFVLICSILLGIIINYSYVLGIINFNNNSSSKVQTPINISIDPISVVKLQAVNNNPISHEKVLRHGLISAVGMKLIKVDFVDEKLSDTLAINTDETEIYEIESASKISEDYCDTAIQRNSTDQKLNLASQASQLNKILKIGDEVYLCLRSETVWKIFLILR